MEHFYLEIPSYKRKMEIIDYINELIFYNSDINGIEILAKILDGYSFEEVLEHCLNLEKKEYAKKLGVTTIITDYRSPAISKEKNYPINTGRLT